MQLVAEAQLYMPDGVFAPHAVSARYGIIKVEDMK